MPTEILGLFPFADLGTFGGVQASGREAWSGITSRWGEQNIASIGYEAGASKMAAVAEAFKTRCHPHLIVIWHLHLMKLAPIVRTPDSRTVLFLHGVEAWKPHGPVTRWLLGQVNLFLSNSEFTWEHFLRLNPGLAGSLHRTVQLGLGTPLSERVPDPSPPPAALMIGRMCRSEDYKGHRQMIAAWPMVLKRVPEAELWIAGGGDLRKDLERAARKSGVGDRVRFFGAIPDDEKDRLIAACRCLALPSRGEGFGLVYLEAMRMGRPCLVSDMDAGREVVNPPEAGLAASPTSIEELASATCRLIADGPEWEQWSMRARARYERLFTAQHFRQRLIETIGEI